MSNTVLKSPWTGFFLNEARTLGKTLEWENSYQLSEPNWPQERMKREVNATDHSLRKKKKKIKHIGSEAFTIWHHPWTETEGVIFPHLCPRAIMWSKFLTWIEWWQQSQLQNKGHQMKARKWTFALGVSCYIRCSQRARMNFHPHINLLIWIRNTCIHFIPDFLTQITLTIAIRSKDFEMHIFGNTSVCSLVRSILWSRWAEREGDGSMGLLAQLKAYVSL